jgi:hypothetical protein
MQEHPEDAVRSAQAWARSLGLENAELLAERQVLEDEITSRPEQGAHD